MQLKAILMLTGTALVLGAGVFVPQKTVKVSASVVQNAGEHSYATKAKLAHMALVQVNLARIQHHLKPLTANRKVNAVANVRAKEISKHFTHYKPNGQAYVDTMHLNKSLIAENISYINNTESSDVLNVKTSINDMFYHDGGSNHWGHRKNFLNPNAKHMGVGIYIDKSHSIYLAFTITN